MFCFCCFCFQLRPELQLSLFNCCTELSVTFCVAGVFSESEIKFEYDLLRLVSPSCSHQVTVFRVIVVLICVVYFSYFCYLAEMLF